MRLAEYVHRSDRADQKNCACFVALLWPALESQQHAHPLARIFDVLRHIQRGEFCFLDGMIFKRLPIQRQPLFFFAGFF